MPLLASGTQRMFEHTFCSIEDRVLEIRNAQVERTVPGERLLVYDVDEGWDPLCAFLCVPAPDEPFPAHQHQG